MNKSDANKIAETITNQQLQDMFDAAKSNITDWRKQSSANKNLTLGAAWNILYGAFDSDRNYVKFDNYVKVTMIREFGDYLPDDLKPAKKTRQNKKTPLFHQEPVFNK